MDNSNFSKNTKLTTSPIFKNSIDLLQQKKTKVIVGHSKGIHFFDSPSYQLSLDIKTQQQFTGKVTCLTVSDQLIFFACGMQVGAVASNGKIIFRFQTFLAAEKIDAIHVCGYRMWLICGDLVNQFLLGGVQLSNKKSRLVSSHNQKTEDIHSHMFDSKINHSIIGGMQFNKPYLLLLMNSNQIQAFQKKVQSTLKTQSPPTYAINYLQESILVGTMGGEIMLIEPSRTKIKILWSINNAKQQGRINCLSMLKNNGFLVCRDKVIQFWNSHKQLLGSQQINEKISSSVYIPQSQAVLYGTKNGDIVLLCDYQKMIKQNAKRNQAQQVTKLYKEIQNLQKEKREIKKMLASTGNAATFTAVNVKHSLTLDYVKLCYNLEFSCDYKILKIIMIGYCTILENDNIFYEEKDKKGVNNLIVRGNQSKSLQMLIKSDQNVKLQYQNAYKVYCQVYVQSSQRKNQSNPGITVIASQIDLKPLALYQKISAKVSQFQEKDNVNVLKIEGNFKYFQMNLWLNTAFNEFGSAQGDAQNFSQTCYQSIISKTKVFIQYKSQLCKVYSHSTTPLSILKKLIIQKSRQKNLNLSYSCETSDKSVNQLIKKIAPSLQHLQKLKQKYQLLPGLLQLKGQILSQELKQIQSKSQQIKHQYNNSKRIYQQSKNDLIQNYISYKGLNNRNVNDFELQNFKTKLIQNASIGQWNTIVKMIIQ